MGGRDMWLGLATGAPYPARNSEAQWLFAISHPAISSLLCFSCGASKGSNFRDMALMAAAALSTPVAGLGGSSVAVKRASSRSKVQLSSAFLQCTNAPMNPFRLEPCMARVTCFPRNWLRRDLSVIGFSLIGWIAPSSIPAINGNSLTGLFLGSIGPELAHWPTGPALDSPFWLWMILWHGGLFIVLLLGQIGFKGRADGYW